MQYTKNRFIRFAVLGIMLTANHAVVGEVAATNMWQNPITKRGSLNSPLVEITPLFFKGKLYLLECWRNGWDCSELPSHTQKKRSEIWMAELPEGPEHYDRRRYVSRPMTNHTMGSAIVWDDKVYVFSTAAQGTRDGFIVDMTWSDDMEKWSEPVKVFESNRGKMDPFPRRHVYNVAMTRDPKGMVFLWETDGVGGPFTMCYGRVEKPTDPWNPGIIKNARYGMGKYTGGPALYYEGGWYYTLYLENLGTQPRTWETRITRSRDLVNWEDAPGGRPVVKFDPKRTGPGKSRERNASDVELCYHDGRTILFFTGGNQTSFSDLQWATFDGTPRELFESFFDNISNSEPSALKAGPVLETTQPRLETGRFEIGARLFSDREYVASPEVPKDLFGMTFIHASIDGDGGFECQEAGLLYALTPGKRKGAGTQITALERSGFVRQGVPEFQLFGVNAIDRVLLYARKVEAGDTIAFSKYTVLLAPKLELKVKVKPIEMETLYNGITLESDPRRRTNMSAYGNAPLPVPYLEHPPEVIGIDVGRQLFVDDFLIETTSLQRVWHHAVKDARSPVMRPETVLERGTQSGNGAMSAPFSGGVWYDGSDGLFKMWYAAGWYDGMAYASSQDGITWARPQLNVVPGTNRVLPAKGTRDSAAVVMDPDAPAGGMRFKMLVYYIHRVGGKLFESHDGLIWGDPVTSARIGDRSTIFYNPFRRVWVYSIRSSWSGRSREYSDSADFLGGARLTNRVKWLRADSLDLAEPVWFYAFPDRRPGQRGGTPRLYNFDAVAYESLMLGAFTIYLGPDNSVCAAEGVPKLTELHLGFSRDGFHWSRPDDRSPFIPASRTAGTWDRAYLHSNAALCLVMGDELWFYYTGFKGDPARKKLPIERNGMYAEASVGVARLRRDGFASMTAGENEGVLTTRSLVFTQGDRLFVNVNCPEGKLRVEVLDADGAVIPGLSEEECEAIVLDATRVAVRWKDGPRLGSLQGRPVRLRFHLKQGDLYAFWVADADGASHGYLAGGGPGHASLRDDGRKEGLKDR